MNQELQALLAKHSQVRFGFARPDWNRVRADVQAVGGDFAELAQAAARLWMDTVARAFGNGAKVQVEGKRTYALLPEGEASKQAQRWVEHCVAELRVFLSGIVRDQEEPLVVLLFDDRDAFVSYVMDFFVAVGEEHDDPEELAHLGSTYHSDGFPQIVASLHEGSSQSSLAHDLTGSMLVHLTLPAWLYSGIVQSMVGLLTGKDMRPSASEVTAVRRAYNAESMQMFWSGASFSDSYAARPSQTMAYMFVQALSGSYERLVRLVTNPMLSLRDAGDAAFHVEYGHGLENLAARILGNGLWAPDPAAIAQSRADSEAQSGDAE